MAGPIENLDGIDIIGVRHDGGVDLAIVASAKLDASESTQRLLMKKIEGYLGYINTPDFEQEFGRPTAERVHIILTVKEPPDAVIDLLVERIKPWAKSNNATFRVETAASA